MGFSATKDRGVYIVHVDGQLIVGNRQELKAAVQEALDQGERKFLIDFRGPVTSIHRVWVPWCRFPSGSASRVGSFACQASTKTCVRCSELTKLDTLFSIAETAEQALGSY